VFRIITDQLVQR